MTNIYQDNIIKKFKNSSIHFEKKDDLLIYKAKHNHIIYIQFDYDEKNPQDIRIFTSPLDTLKKHDDEQEKYFEYFDLAKTANLLNQANIFRWYITENGNLIGDYYERLSPKSYIAEVFMILARLVSALDIWDSVQEKMHKI